MNPPPSHIGFRNWRRYQHYTDRKPPWIKLHTSFPEESAHMSDDARFLACLLFCVAANKNNRIPNDAHWISVEVQLDKTRVENGLAELIAEGMLGPADSNASSDASIRASGGASNSAGNSAGASRAPARSTEAETDTEEEKPLRIVADAPTPRNDPIWDALIIECGNVSTASERARRNRYVKELRQAGATATEIQRRAQRLRERWPTIDVTDKTLVAHWSKADLALPAGDGRLDAHGVLDYLGSLNADDSALIDLDPREHTITDADWQELTA